MKNLFETFIRDFIEKQMTEEGKRVLLPDGGDGLKECAVPATKGNNSQIEIDEAARSAQEQERHAGNYRRRP